MTARAYTTAYLALLLTLTLRPTSALTTSHAPHACTTPAQQVKQSKLV